MNLQIRIPNPLPTARAKVEQTKARVNRWAGARLDYAVTEFFRWAMKKRSVQEVIVHQFTSGGTPMCRALSNTIEDHITGNQIDASDIHGLERFIEDAIENIEVQADSVSGLDKYVSEMIEEAEISADNVDGLEDKIEEQVKGMLDEHEIKSENIEGLDVAVRECISNDLRDGDLTDEISETICKKFIAKLSS